MTPSNLDYTLPELATKWNKAENHLLGMAAVGDLALFVKHNSTKLTLLEKEPGAPGYVQLTRDDVQSILEFGITGYYKIYAALWASTLITNYQVKLPHTVFPALPLFC
jgi:hypothetical protein